MDEHEATIRVKALLALLQNQNQEAQRSDNLLPHWQEDSGDQTSPQSEIPHPPPVDNAAKSSINSRSQSIAPSSSSPLDPTLSELFSRISPTTLRYLEDASKYTERNKTVPVEEPSQAALRQAVFACLSRDPDLVKCFGRLMQRQRELEQQLWDERLSITRSYQGEMNVLSRKSAGDQHGDDAPSTKGEIERIEASHLAALKEHCSGKVAKMWSNLVEEQHSKFKVILEDLSSKYMPGALQQRTLVPLVEEYIESQLHQ